MSQQENIQKQLNELRQQLPKDVTLVAVSKTKPLEDIRSAYAMGQRDFGENKVQEMLLKIEALPDDIRWHFIGHLQSKKVKSILGKTHLIHGVDSHKLLDEIEKRSQQQGVITDCLLQIHIAEEQTKFGFDEEEVLGLMEENYFLKNQHIQIIGVMGMATHTTDIAKIKREFIGLKKMFDRLNESDNLSLTTLSMGMSGDYTIAIEAGSNMVRVGSKIFGQRS